MKFARFDAFKYAETPLRRHVISQIAEQLGVSDPRYSKDLYRTTQDTDFKMPRTKFALLLGAFLLVLSVVVVFALGVIAIIAAFAKGSFAQNFTKLLARHRVQHSRPYHPQTCGKVERFHQTLKKFLAKQPPACSIAELQSQIDSFIAYYNASVRTVRAIA